jgi:hypothetical protein
MPCLGKKVRQDSVPHIDLIFPAVIQFLDKESCARSIVSEFSVQGVLQLAGRHFFFFGHCVVNTKVEYRQKFSCPARNYSVSIPRGLLRLKRNGITFENI